MPLVGTFSCLELYLYDIRELASVSGPLCLPLAQPDEVHSGAAVGSGEDEPLVDDGATALPGDVSLLARAQQGHEGELSDLGVHSAPESESVTLSMCLCDIAGIAEKSHGGWCGAKHS